MENIAHLNALWKISTLFALISSTQITLNLPYCTLRGSRGVGSMGAMGAWAPINISSGVTNGCQHTALHIIETED